MDTLFKKSLCPHILDKPPGANPGDVFGNALTVGLYRQQASNLGSGVADIQLAPYQTRHQYSPLKTTNIYE